MVFAVQYSAFNFRHIVRAAITLHAVGGFIAHFKVLQHSDIFPCKMCIILQSWYAEFDFGSINLDFGRVLNAQSPMTLCNFDVVNFI